MIQNTNAKAVLLILSRCPHWTLVDTPIHVNTYMEIQIKIHIWKYKYKYNTKSKYNNKNLPHGTSDILILPRLTLVDRALKDYKLLQI